MFRLFKNPSCPKCGTETQETGYSFPYAQYRCERCIRENKRIKNEQKRIFELEEKLNIVQQQLFAIKKSTNKGDE